MITSNISGIRIAGIAAAVSNNWSSVESFRTEENGVMIDKFIKTTGVKGRYNAGQYQTTSDFCYVAARELLKSKDISTDEIGALVFVTQTADYLVPATACVLHKRLGLSKDCIAFDVNLGCSGYVYGLNILSSIMTTTNVSKALLLAGDTSAKEMSSMRAVKEGNSFKMLFGDSGTATLLEKQENAPKISGMYRTDGEGFKAIIRPYGRWRNPDGPESPRMDDVAVFNFTISEIPLMIREFFEMQGTEEADYDCLVPHQANLYILKQMAKRAKFPFEKVLVSIDEFGNTSSSSIPITLVKQYAQIEDDRAIRALMCGFGVGLSWGIVSAEIDTRNILPLIHTDEYFEDGYQNQE